MALRRSSCRAGSFSGRAEELKSGVLITAARCRPLPAPAAGLAARGRGRRVLPPRAAAPALPAGAHPAPPGTLGGRYGRGRARLLACAFAHCSCGARVVAPLWEAGRSELPTLSPLPPHSLRAVASPQESSDTRFCCLKLLCNIVLQLASEPSVYQLGEGGQGGRPGGLPCLAQAAPSRPTLMRHACMHARTRGSCYAPSQQCMLTLPR